MILFFQLVFWVSALALIHTYVLYPAMMRILAEFSSEKSNLFANNDRELPVVSIIMSVYNEEKVIKDKLKSLSDLDYPTHKLHFYIGSDGSSDATNELVIAAAEHFSQFQFSPFRVRRGKPPVINDLVFRALQDNGNAADHILLLTDASVIMEADALYLLIRHFKDAQIGVVDAHIKPIGLRAQGISKSEDTYIGQEVMLKHYESRAWGTMIGPFGGCYAIRSHLFEPIPPNFLVDDFLITFRAMEKGYAAINDLSAVCYEGATHEVKDEYRRKKRIAAGSFQNLNYFKKWVLPPVTKLGFGFFSHKVLRWFGGFLLLAAGLSAGALAFMGISFFGLVFWVFLGLVIGVPVIHALTQKLGFELPLLRHIHYFLAMNVALMDGFFKYLRGIKTNTWERTKRY